MAALNLLIIEHWHRILTIILAILLIIFINIRARIHGQNYRYFAHISLSIILLSGIPLINILSQVYLFNEAVKETIKSLLFLSGSLFLFITLFKEHLIKP